MLTKTNCVLLSFGNLGCPVPVLYPDLCVPVLFVSWTYYIDLCLIYLAPLPRSVMHFVSFFHLVPALCLLIPAWACVSNSYISQCSNEAYFGQCHSKAFVAVVYVLIYACTNQCSSRAYRWQFIQPMLISTWLITLYHVHSNSRKLVERDSLERILADWLIRLC